MNSGNKSLKTRYLLAFLTPIALLSLSASPSMAYERDLSARRMASLPGAQNGMAQQQAMHRRGMGNGQMMGTGVGGMAANGGANMVGNANSAGNMSGMGANSMTGTDANVTPANLQGANGLTVNNGAVNNGSVNNGSVNNGDVNGTASVGNATQTGMATNAPLPANVRPDDPVYQAWQEFLQKRGGAQASAAPAGDNAAVATQAQPAKVVEPQPEVMQTADAPSGAAGLIATTKVAQDEMAPAADIRQGGFLPGEGLTGLLATVVGGMGLAGAWVLRKKAPGLGAWLRAQGKEGERTRVKVVSVNPLSAQGSIAVVEVGGQMLVLGVTSGRVSLLTRLDQNGTPVPVREVEDLETDPIAAATTAPSALFRETPKETTAPRSAVASDFSALLNNLAKESTEAPNPNSPLARYAAMNNLKKDAAVEPPPEDMATQVLRKMKTMKRFRNAA